MRKSLKDLGYRRVGILLLSLVFVFLSGWLITVSEKWALIVPVLATVVLILVRPFWGLLLFAVLIPLESAFLSLGGGAATVTRFLGLFIFGVWVIQIIFKRLKIFVPSNLKYAIAFISWGCISILWAFNQSATLDRIQTALQLIMLALLVVNLVDDPEKLRHLLVALFIGCFIATFLGVMGIGVESDHYLLTLQNQGAKEYGSYVGIIFLVGTILLIFTKGKDRSIGMVAILFSIIPLIRVNERGVFLAVGLAWMAIALITRQKARTIFIIVLLSIIVYILPAVLEQRGVISSYNAERLTIQNIIETGGTGRIEIWDVGFRMFKNNWIAGAGWGNFPFVYFQYTPNTLLGLTSKITGSDPHGDLMGVAGELGLIGVLLFLTFYSKILLNNLKKYHDLKGAQNNVLAILVIALLVYCFSIGLTSTYLWRKVYWLILGLGILVPKLLATNECENALKGIASDKST